MVRREAFPARLYLSTIGEDARELALRYGLGLEMAEFCTASNLDKDRDTWLPLARERMAGISRFWFHAPFAELSPAAIDPLVREVTARRYGQALDMALGLGIRRMVVHSGFVPLVYFPEWFTEQSIEFWKEFLKTVPEDFQIALENVMEPGPEITLDIVRGVNDPRFGLCLDVGHANANCSKVPPVEWVEVMGPWLRHVHIHNNQGDWDLHSSLGCGTIPMERILDRLLELDVTFTIENMTCGASVDWLLERGYLT